MPEKPFRSEDREPRPGAPMDNPEQFKTDKESINEMHEEQLTVDDVPLEDLKQDMQDEKHEHHQKDSSSTEDKFKGGTAGEDDQNGQKREY